MYMIERMRQALTSGLSSNKELVLGKIFIATGTWALLQQKFLFRYFWQTLLLRKISSMGLSN